MRQDFARIVDMDFSMDENKLEAVVKKVVDKAVKPIRKQLNDQGVGLAAINKRLDDPQTGLVAINKRLDEKLAAFEERLKKHTTESVKQLSADVGDFIGENLLPMIEEKADKSDIDRLERKLDRVIDTSIDYGSRIKDIEQIPAIAHELRAKKHR